MAIDTKNVSTRRKPHYDTIDEIVADAECLASGGAKTVGNWSQGQIYRHLGELMNLSIDGLDLQPPWYFKVAGRLLKRRFLAKPLPPGFQLPRSSKLRPPENVDVGEGLQFLRDAVERLKNDPTRKPSPILGALSNEQWDQLHCRHAELHMSYIVHA